MSQVTIDISDDLAPQARRTAEAKQQSLPEFVVDALARQMTASEIFPASAPQTPFGFQ